MTTIEEKTASYATVSKCVSDFFIVLFVFLCLYFWYFVCFCCCSLFGFWSFWFLDFFLCLFICSFVGVLLPENE